MDKGDMGGACGGSAAWVVRGGREEQVARGSAVGFVVTRGTRVKKKWLMGRLSGVGLGGTVEPGSAQDRTKISFFNISTSSSLKILRVALLVLQKIPKLCQGVDQFRRNNFPYWQIFKFPHDFKLQFLEIIQIEIFLEF
jgi:hypothetical protein